VNVALGMNPDSINNWPDGMIMRAAGLSGDGYLVVTEDWESTAKREAFLKERLEPALAEGGVTGPPSSATWIKLDSHLHLGDQQGS
jgi:hypothetical protein